MRRTASRSHSQRPVSASLEAAEIPKSPVNAKYRGNSVVPDVLPRVESGCPEPASSME